MRSGGNCYEAASNYIIDKGPDANLTLVHGEVTGQREKLKYGHAWIEDGDLVIDVSNGRDLRLPKQTYYALGSIDHRPGHQNLYKYTYPQTLDNLLKHENYGPWNLETN